MTAGVDTRLGESDLHSSLSAEISRMLELLAAYRGDGESEPPQGDGLPSLDNLQQVLRLSQFERDFLMLTAAVELEGAVAAEVAGLTGLADSRPTLGLALSCLPGAHWDALLPESPLRSWRLIDLSGDGPLATRQVAIDERILHHLLGLSSLDRRLRGIAYSLPPPGLLTPTQLDTANRLEKLTRSYETPVTVNLTGDDPDALVAVASLLVETAGDTLLRIEPRALPHPGPDLYEVCRIIDREGLLTGQVPLVIAHEEAASLDAFFNLTRAPLVVVIGEQPIGGNDLGSRTVLTQRIPGPTTTEQRQAWHAALDGQVNGDIAKAIDDVSQGHRLSVSTIGAIAAEITASEGGMSADRVREESRVRSRVSLEPHAQLLSSRAGWDDIVLPPAHLETLRDIARHVRHRATVYESWGFADRSDRGLGITALFSGESGTGKTLAAEILANALGLDLYRIDLAATVSKYIGETEKNLARIFDGAESSGAVLLFDEAEALFGKRTEVRDSHDRYANIEIAYLLQRMEAYRGLAILTTNLRANLDRAFTRRLRFVVQFPFPDMADRAEIWRRVFPPRVPLEGIDPANLARLTITGGSIWSIALSAAFAAVDTGSPVTNQHLIHAARAEYAKADRTLTDTEMGALR